MVFLALYEVEKIHEPIFELHEILLWVKLIMKMMIIQKL
jgi:hypothetical protein